MDQIYNITQNRWEKTKDTKNKKIDENGQKWVRMVNGYGWNWYKISIVDLELSPLKGLPTVDKPWEGNCYLKPWEYPVTVAIPCLDTLETLPICIELLQLQTVKPFIMIIDTGTDFDKRDELEELRTDNVEIHYIDLHGVRHPSDYPAMAMDLAFTLCRSEYCFATHADCFLRNRNLIEEMLELCKENQVVGYELTPRAHADWKGMVSHTASMYHMPTMDKIGFGWSLRRLCSQFDIVDYSPDPMKPNWPDTEILGNYILRKNNIVPCIIGHEENSSRTLDNNIDHFRSYTAAKLYSPCHFNKINDWFMDAKEEAIKRIEEWKVQSNMLL